MKISEYTNISVAIDFTMSPGARYRSDGKFSGEEFYEDILKPKVNDAWNDTGKGIFIDFDGTFGYASSFISEVFIRLVKDFPDKKKIKEIFKFKSNEDSFLIEAINHIIEETKTE